MNAYDRIANKKILVFEISLKNWHRTKTCLILVYPTFTQSRIYELGYFLKLKATVLHNNVPDTYFRQNVV